MNFRISELSDGNISLEHWCWYMYDSRISVPKLTLNEHSTELDSTF